jgi:hypothetical protein
MQLVPRPAGRPPVTAARLRRTVEQILASHPRGLPWRVVWEEASLRVTATGAAPPTRDAVVRCLGGLLVEGRVDERDGRFVLRTVGSSSPARLSA